MYTKYLAVVRNYRPWKLRRTAGPSRNTFQIGPFYVRIGKFR